MGCLNSVKPAVRHERWGPNLCQGLLSRTIGRRVVTLFRNDSWFRVRERGGIFDGSEDTRIIHAALRQYPFWVKGHDFHTIVTHGVLRS